MTGNYSVGIKTENEIKEIAETSKDYYLGKVQCNDTYVNNGYYYPTYIAKYPSDYNSGWYCFWMSGNKLENPFILEIPEINYPSAITFRPNGKYDNRWTNTCNFQLYFDGNKKYECDIEDMAIPNQTKVYKVMINTKTNSYQTSNIAQATYDSALSEDNVYPFSE